MILHFGIQNIVYKFWFNDGLEVEFEETKNINNIKDIKTHLNISVKILDDNLHMHQSNLFLAQGEMLNNITWNDKIRIK